MKIKLWAVHVVNWDPQHEHTSVRMFGTRKEAVELMEREFGLYTNPDWYNVKSMVDRTDHKRAVYYHDRGGVEYTLREEYVDVDESAVVKPVTRKEWALVAEYWDSSVENISMHLTREGAVIAMGEYVKSMLVDDLLKIGVEFAFDVTGDEIVISIASDVNTTLRIKEMEVPV